MRKIALFLVCIIFLSVSNQLISQETKSISQSRKDNIMELLNYRFKGGYYAFEKLFNQTVEYPQMAIGNCVVGIAIISFRVDCDGEVFDVKNKSPLGYGIDHEISIFFSETVGHWNTCNDDKYTKFEVPIQFYLAGTKTNTEDALLIIETENPGFLCNGDEYYINKIDKYISKGKYKRAMPYINIMMRRDPYNTHYYDLMKKAVNGGE